METATITTAITIFGLVCIWIVLAVLSLLTVGWGRWMFSRLRRCYHMTVIAYWLDRLERGGWRVFQKAENDDKLSTARARGEGGAKG